MTASLAMRALNFGSQIVLGAILFVEDFGLFAITTSVAAFVLVLQDGGMRTLLVQRGEDSYEELEGPAFWLGLAFNLLAGSLLAALAPLVALLYAEPKLTPMLWIIATAIPLSSIGSVSLARLATRMSFGVLSAIEVMSGIVRYGGMIVGAVAGLGPIAFVAPLPAVAVLEGIAAYFFTRRTPWMHPPRMDRWRGLLGASGWLIVSVLAGTALYTGSHMALGLTASTALVGMFFFGYGFMQQSGYLIISTAEKVLLPVFSRLRAEPERQRSAVVKTLGAISVLGFSTCAGLGALFAPLENLIWKGKWAAAIGVVQVMAICYPIFILHIIARCVITASGRFRAHAISVALAGVTLMLVAVVSGRVTTDSAVVSWIMGIAMTLVSLAYFGWGVRDLRLRPMEIVAETGPVAMCGAAAFLAGILTDRFTHGALTARGYDPLDEEFRMRLLGNGVRLLAAGTSCAVVLAVTLRVFVPKALRACFDVLPDRLGRPATRLLRL